MAPRHSLGRPQHDLRISVTHRCDFCSRADHYSEIRTSFTTPLAKVEMSHMGG